MPCSAKVLPLDFPNRHMISRSITPSWCPSDQKKRTASHKLHRGHKQPSTNPKENVMQGFDWAGATKDTGHCTRSRSVDAVRADIQAPQIHPDHRNASDPEPTQPQDQHWKKHIKFKNGEKSLNCWNKSECKSNEACVIVVFDATFHTSEKYCRYEFRINLRTKHALICK